MFTDEFISYLFIFLAFILLILVIKFWPVKKEKQRSVVLKYQKFDLLKDEITTLSVKEFEYEVNRLAQDDYEFSFLNELYNFSEHYAQLPDKVFVILSEYEIIQPVKKLTLELIKHRKEIIFFWPILQMEVSGKEVVIDKSRIQKEVGNINTGLISSSKNIFIPTQPIIQFIATI